MASQMSSTLPAQDDQVAIGGWLYSKTSIYQVQSILGQGAFGTVAKCLRVTDMKTVAIKMMKNQGPLVVQARAEVAVLIKLKSLDLDECNIVRWYQDFTCIGHNCLEFEHLDKSLFDFMKEWFFRPLLLKEIRPIVQQLTTALKHLKAVGIIHADLKLEYVMLVSHLQEPFKVKVIDFGLADHVSAARVGAYIQTHPYRSPEVLLGLPYTEAIDMWSLGCIAAELYLGFRLFPGINEYDMMRHIMQIRGQPSHNMLSRGSKTTWFFQWDETSTTDPWKVKRETQTSDSGTAVRGPQKPSSSRTTFPIQQDLNQPHNIDPCSGTQATRSVQSGVKRRADEGDKMVNETSHLSKMIRSGWHRGNGAGPSTCSSSHNGNTLHNPSDGRNHRAHTSLSTQTESRAQSGLKRSAEDDNEDVLHKTETSDLQADKKRPRTVMC